jgi:hypothetical protein
MNDRIVDAGIDGADASSGAHGDYEKEPAATVATPTRPCQCAHDRNLHQGFAADDGGAERNTDHCEREIDPIAYFLNSWRPQDPMILAPRPGLEPGTCGLTVRRAAE